MYIAPVKIKAKYFEDYIGYLNLAQTVTISNRLILFCQSECVTLRVLTHKRTWASIKCSLHKIKGDVHAMIRYKTRQQFSKLGKHIGKKNTAQEMLKKKYFCSL